jgi:hypothetical protein
VLWYFVLPSAIIAFVLGLVSVGIRGSRIMGLLGMLIVGVPLGLAGSIAWQFLEAKRAHEGKNQAEEDRWGREESPEKREVRKEPESAANRARLGMPAYVVTLADLSDEVQAKNVIELDKKYKGKTIDVTGTFFGITSKEMAVLIFPNEQPSQYMFTMAGGQIGFYGKVDPSAETSFSKLKMGDLIRVRFRCSHTPALYAWRTGPCLLIEVKKQSDVEKAKEKRKAEAARVKATKREQAAKKARQEAKEAKAKAKADALARGKAHREREEKEAIEEEKREQAAEKEREARAEERSRNAREAARLRAEEDIRLAPIRAENAAASKLKLAKMMIADDPDNERLKERAVFRLEELVKKYPATKAAAEAKKLLKELGTAK